jgi:hypothetical protein
LGVAKTKSSVWLGIRLCEAVPEERMWCQWGWEGQWHA